MYNDPLSPFPHSMDPQLRKLGLTTSLVKGVPSLTSPHELCKKGRVLSSEQAQLLKLIGEQMAYVQSPFSCTQVIALACSLPRAVILNRGACTDPALLQLPFPSTFKVQLSGMWSEVDGFVPGPHADAVEGGSDDEEVMA